ncbi:MAG: IS1/IS1595 family N-terminal zinc-binding domain-containing protein [Gammaproteobacteria bacterium]
MNGCKRCDSKEVVKNGCVREQQRYRCKSCGLNFVMGDKRVKPDTAVKRAFAVILYALGKSSYGFIAKLFGVTPPAVQKWLKREAAGLGEPEIPATIQEMEFDEMWHFIGSKKTTFGSSRRWIVLHGELLPGLSAIVMLQPSNGSTTK